MPVYANASANLPNLAITRPGPNAPLIAMHFSPAAERNKATLLEVLRRVLPFSGLVLEVASGTGQHIVHFAACLPGLVWQPSENSELARSSIAERVRSAGLDNLRPPLSLDVAAARWPCPAANAVIASKLLHIAPTAVREGLFRGAATLLGSGEPLCIYGPFRPGSDPEGPSPASHLAGWTVHEVVPDIDAVTRAAAAHGFADAEVIEMPEREHWLLVVRKG